IRRLAGLGFATIAAVPAIAQRSSATIAGFGTIRGTVIDSLHGTPLAGAIVLADGLVRIGQTGPDGQFAIDSVPPGSYRMQLSHPLLDTIGMTVTTPAMTVRSGEIVFVDMALPSPDHIISLLCPPPTLARGPGALIGQVVDP